MRCNLIILCVVLAILLVILGCSGCKPQRETETADASRIVTVTVWHPWGGVQKEGFEAVVREFNRTHKNVKAKPLFAPNDIGSNQKFFTAVAANKPPDVTFVDGTQTSSWAEQGALVPLEALIERDKIEPEEYFAPCWRQSCYKGHIWAMTYGADPNFALVWNKKIFREAGLDPDKPPTTIAELDEYTRRITKTSNGKLIRTGLIPWAQYGAANSLFTWGWAFGGSFYDPETRKITANDRRVVKALEWMASYAKKYDIRKINSLASGFGSRDQDPLYTGQMAIRCLYISGIADIKRYAPNLDYGIGYLPAPPDGEPRSSWVGGWCLAIPKGCKHPKEAWEFIKWATHSPEGTTAMGRKQGLFPGLIASPYLKEVENKPGYSQFLEILKECKHQRPAMPAQAFYMNALDRAVEYAIYGRKTPKQALDDATRETQAELDLRLAGG